MTSIFDGISGVLNGVFGAPVTITRGAVPVMTTRAIFRSLPIEVTDDIGNAILTERPTLQIRKPDASTIAFGDILDPGNGKTYRIESPHPTGSPAADAFVVYLLEEIEA